MKVGGESAGWRWAGEGGGYGGEEGRGGEGKEGRDRDLSSTAGLMRPHMAIKQPSVSWCLPLN